MQMAMIDMNQDTRIVLDQALFSFEYVYSYRKNWIVIFWVLQVLNSSF